MGLRKLLGFKKTAKDAGNAAAEKVINTLSSQGFTSTVIQHLLNEFKNKAKQDEFALALCIIIDKTIKAFGDNCTDQIKTLAPYILELTDQHIQAVLNFFIEQGGNKLTVVIQTILESGSRHADRIVQDALHTLINQGGDKLQTVLEALLNQATNQLRKGTNTIIQNALHTVIVNGGSKAEDILTSLIKFTAKETEIVAKNLTVHLAMLITQTSDDIAKSTLLPLLNQCRISLKKDADELIKHFGNTLDNSSQNAIRLIFNCLTSETTMDFITDTSDHITQTIGNKTKDVINGTAFNQILSTINNFAQHYLELDNDGLKIAHSFTSILISEFIICEHKRSRATIQVHDKKLAELLLGSKEKPGELVFYVERTLNQFPLKAGYLSGKFLTEEEIRHFVSAKWYVFQSLIGRDQFLSECIELEKIAKGKNNFDMLRNRDLLAIALNLAIFHAYKYLGKIKAMNIIDSKMGVDFITRFIFNQNMYHDKSEYLKAAYNTFIARQNSATILQPTTTTQTTSNYNTESAPQQEKLEMLIIKIKGLTNNSTTIFPIKFNADKGNYYLAAIKNSTGNIMLLLYQCNNKDNGQIWFFRELKEKLKIDKIKSYAIFYKIYDEKKLQVEILKDIRLRLIEQKNYQHNQMHSNKDKQTTDNAKFDIYIDPNGGKKFKSHKVDSDGDCGYKAFGISRNQAYDYLQDNWDKVKDLLKCPIKELIVESAQAKLFINYLEKQEGIPQEIFNQSDLLITLIEKGNPEDAINILLEPKNERLVIKAYLDYDIRDKKIENGWAHPAILQALAHIMSIDLTIWTGGSQRLSKFPQYHRYTPESATKQLILVFVNNNHYEWLEYLDAETNEPLSSNKQQFFEQTRHASATTTQTTNNEKYGTRNSKNL